MQDLGVTQVWLPPPSQSVSRQGYLPGQLYDLNTPYGSKEELTSLLKQFVEAGMAPLADIVINHRCADQQDETGQWNIFTCDLPDSAWLCTEHFAERVVSHVLSRPTLTNRSTSALETRDSKHFIDSPQAPSSRQRSDFSVSCAQIP